MSAVAYGLNWKPGDEVITAIREFPLQYATWKPMEEREGIKLKIVSPRERFLDRRRRDRRADAEDASRFRQPGALRQRRAARCRARCRCLPCARRLVAARRQPGVRRGSDRCCKRDGRRFSRLRRIQISARPVRHRILLGQARASSPTCAPARFTGWRARASDVILPSMNFADPKPARKRRRWDAAETANYFNHAALDACGRICFAGRTRDRRAQHNRNLIELLYERLPKDRCVPTSPLDARTSRPVCLLRARSAGKDRRALRQTAQGKHHRQPARRQHSRFALSVQHRARHRPPDFGDHHMTRRRPALAIRPQRSPSSALAPSAVTSAECSLALVPRS